MRSRFLRSSRHRMWHKRCPRASALSGLSRSYAVENPRAIGMDAPAGVAASRRFSTLLMRWLKAPLHIFDKLVDAEARWALARRKLLDAGHNAATNAIAGEERNPS